MKCLLCGYSFVAEEGVRACQGCPLVGDCGKLRCPNCGYEIPKESRLSHALRALRRKP